MHYGIRAMLRVSCGEVHEFVFVQGFRASADEAFEECEIAYSNLDSIVGFGRELASGRLEVVSQFFVCGSSKESCRSMFRVRVAVIR